MLKIDQLQVLHDVGDFSVAAGRFSVIRKYPVRLAGLFFVTELSRFEDLLAVDL